MELCVSVFFADEARLITATAAMAALSFMGFVAVAQLTKRWLGRPLARLAVPHEQLSSWRGPALGAGLTLAFLAGALAYQFHSEDLTPALWLVPAGAGVLALAVSRALASVRVVAIRFVWILCTLQALAALKLTYFPRQDALGMQLASDVTVFNVLHATAYPLFWLSSRFGMTAIEPGIEQVLSNMSTTARFVLVPSLALVSVGFAHILAVWFPASAKRHQPTPRWLVPMGLVLTLLPVLVHTRCEFVSPCWKAICLWLALAIPAWITARAKEPFDPMFVLAVLLSGAAIWLVGEPFRLAGTGFLVLQCGGGLVILAGARALLLDAGCRPRGGLAAVVWVGFFLTPVVAIMLMILGAARLLFGVGPRAGCMQPTTDKACDFEGESADESMVGHVSSQPLFARVGAQRLWTSPAILVLGSLPLYLFLSATAMWAQGTTPHPNTAALLQPTDILPTISPDPWQESQSQCQQRGLRPCQAAALSCVSSPRCRRSYQELSGTGPSFIALPDRGVGRYFSGTGGWFPDWSDEGGALPRQFTLPSHVEPRDIFPRARQLLFCCSEEP